MRAVTDFSTAFAWVTTVITSSAAALLIRLSRKRAGGSYQDSTAIMLSESLKLLVYVIGIRFQRSTNQATVPEQGTVGMRAIVSCQGGPKVLLAAGLLFSHNYLKFIASSCLGVAQVLSLNQMSICTAAVFATFLLGHAVAIRERFALAVLVVGAIIVQLPKNLNGPSENSFGLWSGILVPWISGFFETYMQSAKVSRSSQLGLNLELSVYSVTLSLFAVAVQSGAKLREGQDWIWSGYSVWTWLAIVAHGLNGLTFSNALNSLSRTHRNSAGACAMILSSFAAVRILDEAFTLYVTLGLFLIFFATIQCNCWDSFSKIGTISYGIVRSDGTSAKHFRQRNVSRSIFRPMLSMSGGILVILLVWTTRWTFLYSVTPAFLTPSIPCTFNHTGPLHDEDLNCLIEVFPFATPTKLRPVVNGTHKIKGISWNDGTPPIAYPSFLS
ncbi:uncharacterized protein EV422DRAFT_209860 [Fimicolochytrium jonesii]|uniref:uncharacterized protein n=1 Tax=Fimicolochytrium jonesii TaxID=1396493 RepID=UPI0022FEDE68|nr:uncharacterized protein EV422DRAFT_209860 [Fimicolochytrium jonesii]KAI8817630.1 hypothetical protein EV422DRAFT_209860 [Fimicolochytrium jonesii]